MKSRRAFVRALSGASFVSLADATFAKERLTLASEGRSSYSIFLSPAASLSEQWAAKELRQHLQEMTGAVLPIVSSDTFPKSADVIAIGQNAVTESLRIDPPSGESFVLKTAGRTVIVAGGRERGTMYGVYALLEKLGCRWFTADVARVPKVSELRLPALDERGGPAFQYREVFFTEALGKEWSARNRLNGHFHQLDASTGGKISFHPFAHSFYDLVPPAEYFSAHPEYFALFAGRRRAEHAQLCLTNPDVVRLSVNRIEQWIREDPDASAYSVSQNDTGGWCECDPCRRVIAEEGGAVSGLLLRFVNAVAEQIPASRTVDTLAYLETFNPPAKTRPGPNVSIRLCPIDACQAHSYFSCPYNTQVRQAVTKWSQIAPKLCLWLYSTNFGHYLMPFPNFDELARDIPKFHSAGVSGIFVEGAGSGGGRCDDAELRSYIAARLLWNPAVRVDYEIRDFLDAVYGPAAPAMSKYFSLQHREVRHGKHLWIDQDVLPVEGRDLLLQAHERASALTAKKRIEGKLLSIDYAAAIRSRRFEIRDGAYAPEDLAGARTKMQTVVTKAQELGLVQFREGYPLSRQATDFDALLRAYETVSLTDGTLSATVVPDLEARVIRLGTGNALRVPSPGEWAYPRAGGLFVRLYPNYLSDPVPVTWRVTSASREAVTLAGTSERGLALTLVYRLAAGFLKCEIIAENPTPLTVPVALRWQAEFPLRLEPRPDEITMLTNVQLPRIKGIPVQNRFHPEQIGRAVLTKSFRSAAHANLSLWSPETTLSAGGRLSLASDYALI